VVRFLLGQPASPASGDFLYNIARKPAVGGLLVIGEKSLGSEFDIYSVYCSENLRVFSALWPFSGESNWRLGSIALRDRPSTQRTYEGIGFKGCTSL
jgi:hypothetical protein